MSTDDFDLDAYLSRIGYDGPRTPSVEVLGDLHTAQVFSIPFENLAIQLREPISLGVADMMAKMVHGPRGGYCFELNGLFAIALETLGFQVDRLAARVRYGNPLVGPRMHQLLAVKFDHETWIADVGFGGNGLIAPVPLVLDEEFSQYGEIFRLKQESNGEYVLEGHLPDGWLDLYAFTLEPLYRVDFEAPNYFMSTSPASPFGQTRIVALPNPQGRTILVEQELKVRNNGETVTSDVGDGDAYIQELRSRFGIDIPKGSTFTPLNKPT